MIESNVLDTVIRLKQRAQTARKRGKYDEAHKYLDEALIMLKREYQNVNDPKYKAEIRFHLADSFGMKGGILRREGQHHAALDQYNLGIDFEDVDTYNLSNTISLPIILDGRQLATPMMAQKLEDAIKKIKQQIDSGKRSGEWWAWADLGMFFLLAGQSDKAIEAYSNMRGAKDEPYSSHIAVLSELLDSLRKAGSPIAKDVERAISYLREEKAKWTPPVAPL